MLLTGGFNWLTFEPGPPVLDAVIRRNDISMTGSCCGAISIFDSVSFSTIGQNTLRGSALLGVGLLPTGLVEPTEAVGNTFIDNDISQLTASLAHVLFFNHARHNVCGEAQAGPSSISAWTTSSRTDARADDLPSAHQEHGDLGVA